MKLFQIEEPDGAPAESDGPGAAVGIDLAGGVAIALGGNAELLRGRDGAGWGAAQDAAATLALLKQRAEQALMRPVTHAVIAADAPADALERAAAGLGLAVLRLIPRAQAAALARGALPAEAAALGAAILAEDLAPALPAGG